MKGSTEVKMKTLVAIKLAIVATVVFGIVFFGLVRSPRIEPRDVDVATLVRQAREIGAAWRQFRDEPGRPRPQPQRGFLEELKSVTRVWWTQMLEGDPDSLVTRDLRDKIWRDGSSDLAPYLGALPVPPASVVDLQNEYSYWIPVWANDPTFANGPQGYTQPPNQASSGFLIRLDPARPEICRAIAQASGRGNGLPYAVTGRADWARAANLGAGDFACVWLDRDENGKLEPGDPAFLLFRAI
jgi:hypothetical protein